MVGVSKETLAVPNRMAAPTAVEIGVKPIARSFATVFEVQEGCLERRLVYINITYSNCKYAIPSVGAGRPRMKVLAERIIIWIDGHHGTIGRRQAP